MSAKSQIRTLVDRELTRLLSLPALEPEDLDALQSLAKTAAVAEGLSDASNVDPEADSSALEDALLGR